MGEGARILIVDDNINLCRTMSLILAHKGYDVATAGSGPEAIGRVEESHFDMVFMDIKMPLMNGVETYKRIKEIRPDTTVMMMTAYAVEDLVREALDEGAYGVVYKPVDMDEIIALLGEPEKTEDKERAFVQLVDDHEETCCALKEVLVRSGYEVGVAHTGEEAVGMARERASDIVLIDMKLPSMNGLDTYKAIRRLNPATVAILMTGYRLEMADLVEEALRNNADTCLYKPLDMHDLLGMIGEIVRRKQATG